MIILMWFGFIVSISVFVTTILRLIVLWNDYSINKLGEFIWVILSIGVFIFSGNYIWDWL